ncbi:MAG: hypothetical protein VKK42_30405 [Lyngbya sp.]|nr:hypothetical protein [Lyngbya sp.]
MEELPVSQLFEIGANGAIVFIIWNLFQTNQKLVEELRSRDDKLCNIIDVLLAERHNRVRSPPNE